MPSKRMYAPRCAARPAISGACSSTANGPLMRPRDSAIESNTSCAEAGTSSRVVSMRTRGIVAFPWVPRSYRPSIAGHPRRYDDRAERRPGSHEEPAMDGGHIYTGNPLDRAEGHRTDEAWVTTQREHPQARFLAMRALHAAVRPGDAPRLAWSAREALGAVEDDQLVLLGIEDGVPHFAVAVPADADALEGIEFVEARSLGSTLPMAEAGILAQARSMLEWHARHKYCVECGNLMAPA